MKILLSLLLSLAAVAAQAHESSVPHHHPHGVSALPDLDTLIVASLFTIAAALFAFLKFRRR
jgi:hypothetical protein